jgi:RasGAP C-terminus
VAWKTGAAGSRFVSRQLPGTVVRYFQGHMQPRTVLSSSPKGRTEGFNFKFYLKLLRLQELLLLKSTLSSLEQKKQFHQKQVEFYNIYIKTCLESLDTGKK